MRKPFLFAVWAAGVAAAALAATVAVREAGSTAAPDRTALRRPPSDPLPADPGDREELASALRRGEWSVALRRLEPTTDGPEPRGDDAKLLLGFAAHSRGRLEEAERWLGGAREGQMAARDLADWRLFLLADAAASRGNRPLAISALQELMRDCPASPLRARARLKLAELLVAEGKNPAALEWVADGRVEGVSGEPAARLEALAWEIGRRLGDRSVQVEAARKLLVLAPLEASRLQVTQVLTAGGVGDWTSALTPAELEQRAETLLALELAPSAMQSLDAVAPGAREMRWYALKARTLVALHRAAEAYELLASSAPGIPNTPNPPNTPNTPAERLLLDWTRAQSAAAAATAVRGRDNLPASARARFQRLEQEALRRAAVQAAADPVIGRLVLRALYANLEAEERVDEAVEILARLRALDPADTTGARHLWERGWREYRTRNFTGAVGYWTQLHDLYPRTFHGRSARYWTARAFASLGETKRAQEIFREVAGASPADFYARQAAGRLAFKSPPPRDEEAAAREPWPEEPLLARARLLSDLGLDELALTEIELLAGRAEPRTESALRGVVLARQGERRESLRLLRRAFPKLGTAFQAEVPREAVDLYYPLDFSDTIRRLAAAQRLPPELVFAVIHQESAFDPQAKSRSGARGLMQVMPATGRELAHQLKMPFSVARLYEPDTSVRLGTTYLRQVLSMFGGNVELALAGYNGGPNRIRQLWRRAGPDPELDSFLEDLSVEESKNYVKRILVLADGYRQLYPSLG